MSAPKTAPETVPGGPAVRARVVGAGEREPAAQERVEAHRPQVRRGLVQQCTIAAGGVGVMQIIGVRGKMQHTRLLDFHQRRFRGAVAGQLLRVLAQHPGDDVDFFRGKFSAKKIPRVFPVV